MFPSRLEQETYNNILNFQKRTQVADGVTLKFGDLGSPWLAVILSCQTPSGFLVLSPVSLIFDLVIL